MEDKLLTLFDMLHRPLSLDELYDNLHIINEDDKFLLGNILCQLENDYIITHNKQNCFQTLEFFKLMVGEIIVKEKGYAFVDGVDKSVFINKYNLLNAITYDTVLVKYDKDEDDRLEGEVVRVIKRGRSKLYGYLYSYKNKFYVKCVDPNIRKEIKIDKYDLNKARVNDLVEVSITKYSSEFLLTGKITKVIGNKNQSIDYVDAIVKSSMIDVTFSKEVLDEARSIPQSLSKNDLNGRVDYRDKLIVTIDGDDAKDLDDAISVCILPNNNFELGVYIADVSHYVLPKSALDKNAFNKSNSTYIPNKVFPMLPKELSNGICSLNEGVDRLVLSCIMEVDRNGNVVDSKITEGVIRSTKRLSYSTVNNYLKGLSSDLSQDIKDLLSNAYDLSKILSKKRASFGAFSFETTDSLLVFDDFGKLVDVKVSIREESERIIEEFMLLCNVCVCNTMAYLDVPFIYRVHEEPDLEKLNKTLEFINLYGKYYKIKNKKQISSVLQTIIKDNDVFDLSVDKDERTKRLIINDAIVRSMAKAKYSEFNIHHFGLHEENYTHFTSPIRRYADLVNHRLIKTFLLGINDSIIDNPMSYYTSLVSKASIKTSLNEKTSEKLERDVINYYKCLYMSSFKNMQFCGVISSITSYGIYVRLDNTIEGLSRYSDMAGFYEYNDILKSCKCVHLNNYYDIGDKVIVKVCGVNLNEREIAFCVEGKVNERNKTTSNRSK